MKRILIALSLFAPGLCYADTVSNGMILVSSSAIPSRSIVDIFNDNFRVSGATLAAHQTRLDNIDTTTNSLNTRLTTAETNITSLTDSTTTLNSNLTDGTATLTVGSVTARSMVTSTTGFSGPGSNLTSLNAANISAGSLGSSVMASSVAGGAVSSVTILNESISGEDIAKGAIRGPNLSADLVLSSHIAANTIVAADVAAGVFISSSSGSVDPFHLKDTAVTPGTYGSATEVPQIIIDADGRATSATNITIDVADGNQVSRRVVVATLGVTGVDVSSNNTDGLIRALEIIGAKGLTTSCTAQGSIFFRNGVYDIGGATIPACINIDVEGSSVVWRADNSRSIVIVYGAPKTNSGINGINFDLKNQTFNGTMIDMKHWSRLSNFSLYGGYGYSAITNGGSAAIGFQSSTMVTVTNGKIDQVNATSPGAGVGFIYCRNSSHVYISNVDFLGNFSGYSGNSVIQQYGCSDFSWTDSVFDNFGERFWAVMDKNKNLFIERNVFFVKQAADANGAFSFFSDGTGGPVISTGCLIADNRFITTTSGGGPIFGFRSSGGGQAAYMDGVVIRDNYAVALTGNTLTFINVGTTDSRKTIIRGNYSYGLTFLSDSGDGTIQTDNYKDGAAQ